MRFRWLPVVGLVMTIQVFSQNFDEVLARKVPDCSDVSMNSAELAMGLIERDRSDSLSLLLDYWESKCGNREVIFRLRTFNELWQGKFSVEDLPANAIDQMGMYTQRMYYQNPLSNYYFDTNPAYFTFIPPGGIFDRFMVNAFNKLKGQYSEGTFERSVINFYTGDEDALFELMASGNYDDTNVGGWYKEELAKAKDLPEFHWSLLFGTWIPTGELSVLGTHPEIGFQMGWKKRRLNYDLAIQFKFLDTDKPYMARRNNTVDFLEETDYFFGGYAGLEVGYDLIAKNSNELQWRVGLAVDGIDIFEENQNAGIEATSIITYNFNTGILYRRYLTETFYVGIGANYNLVDYTRSGYIDYKGNAVNAHVVIGTVNNVYRNQRLKQLGARIRP